MNITTIYAIAWFPLVLVAIINGLIRQELIIPVTSELTGHQISCFTFLLLFFGYVGLIARKWPIQTSKHGRQIGAMWLMMTVAFEFGFGHYVMGHPWEKLFHDYNLAVGRLWVIILIATLVGPELVRRMKKNRSPVL